MSSLEHTPEGTPYIPLSAPRSRTPIFLTPYHTTDAPAVQSTVSLPEVNRHLIAAPWPYTLEDAEWYALFFSYLHAARTHLFLTK
jgi:hypothetical protein